MKALFYFVLALFIALQPAYFYFYFLVIVVTSLQAVHNQARKTIKGLNKELNKWELCTYCS